MMNLLYQDSLNHLFLMIFKAIKKSRTKLKAMNLLCNLKKLGKYQILGMMTVNL
jgi:hypothetical protein